MRDRRACRRLLAAWRRVCCSPRRTLQHTRYPLPTDRPEFSDALQGRHTGPSVHFISLHPQDPYYRDTDGYQPDAFPVADREYQQLISLPIYSKLSDQDGQDVIAAVADVVGKFRRSPEVAAWAVAASTRRALREARHNAEEQGVKCRGVGLRSHRPPGG